MTSSLSWIIVVLAPLGGLAFRRAIVMGQFPVGSFVVFVAGIIALVLIDTLFLSSWGRR